MGRKRKYSLNERYFEAIDTREKAYLLGFLFADGSVHGNYVSVAIHRKDVEILEFLMKELGSNQPIAIYNENYVRVGIHSRKLVEDLGILGLVQNKTYKTNCLIYLKSKKYFNSFLLGFFDGDGSIYTSKNKTNDYTINFSSNCSILKELSEALKEIDVTTSAIRRRNKDSEYSGMLDIKGRINIDKLMLFMYNEAPFFLKRKRERFEELNRNALSGKIHYRGSGIIEQVISLYNSGLKQIEISKILNIPYSSVRGIKQRNIK
jgi:hypothetical protein